MKTDSILIFLTFFFFFSITAVDASAQEMVPEGYQIVDSVILQNNQMDYIVASIEVRINQII